MPKGIPLSGINKGWIKRGSKLSNDIKLKISQSLKGKKKTPEHIRNAGIAQRGKKLSEEHKKLIGLKSIGRIKGDKNPAWKGGITPVHIQIRTSRQYLLWRKNILKFDDYTCRKCGKRGGELNVDHYPISFSAILNKLIIEQGLDNLYDKAINYGMFWDLNNGRTLCINCHRKTDTYGYKARKTIC